MKKFFTLLLVSMSLLSCSNNSLKVIPAKIDDNNLSINGSSVNSLNLDDFLFRNDEVMYIDVRPFSWVLKHGYINSFQFYPFYNYFCEFGSNLENNAFFRSQEVIVDGKVTIKQYEIGSYKPIYNQSINYLKKTISTEKKLFLISSGGVESMYFGNLLVQYGYKASNIYNVGGLNSGCNKPYMYYSGAKNFISGNKLVGTDIDGSLYTVDFEKLRIKGEITLI